MACLIPENWPVQYNDEDPENGNEAEYKADGLKDLIVKESKSAKRNVIVCFVINLIVQMHLSIVDISITDTDLLETLDVDTTEANSANNIYKSLTNLYAPLALFLMSKSSYRTTVAVGSLLICVAFANISFLNNGPEGTISWYWQVWLCGPVALGVSCLKLGAMIPVLEYFKRDRMKALVITRIGTVLGASASIGIMFAESLSWRTLLRINAGLCLPCLAIAFILKDIVITDKLKKENDRNETTDDNKEEDEDKKGCSGIIKEFLKNTFRIPVLKDKTFWITIVVFFFFSFGTSLPTLSLPEISSQMQEQLAPPVDSFYEVLSANVGTLLGLILTYLLKSLPCVESYRNRKRNMGFVFCIITLSGYIMAIMSIVTQENFVYYIVYILVLTIFEVLTENFRDESMPTAFGRFNIRLTQGFLQMSVGLGGLTAATFQNGVDKADNDGGWKLNFRLGGGFLLISGSITGVVLAFDFISKRTFLRHSCFVNILTDGTRTKQKPSPTKSKTCFNYLCCINCWAITENEREKTSKCTHCCDGCTAFNFPQCLTLSCCSRKRPNDQNKAQPCKLLYACCKGVSISCFSSCLRKKQNENKQRKYDIICCKNCSPTCIPKCLSMPCSSKSRPKSQSNESPQTPRKEPICNSKCLSMPCLARKGSFSENDKDKSKCRGLFLPNCVRFQNNQSLSPNTSDLEISTNNTTAHDDTDQNNSNLTGLEINPYTEETPSKECVLSPCLTFPKRQCFSQKSPTSEHKTAHSFNCFHGILCQSIANKVSPTPNQSDYLSDSVHLDLSARSSLSIHTFYQADTELTSSNGVSEIRPMKESTPKLKSGSEHDNENEPEKKDIDNTSVERDNMNKSKESLTSKNKTAACFNWFQCISCQSIANKVTPTPKQSDNVSDSVHLDLSARSSLSIQTFNQVDTELTSSNDVSEIRKESTPKLKSGSEHDIKNEPEKNDNDNKYVDRDNKNKSEDKESKNNSVDVDNKNEPEKKDNDNKYVSGDNKNEPEKKDNDNKSVDADNNNKSEDKDNDNKSVGGDNRNKFENKDNKNKAEVENKLFDIEIKTLTNNPNEGKDRNNDNSQIRNDKPTSPNEKPKAPPTKPIYPIQRLKYRASRIKKMSKKTRKKIKSSVVSQSADIIRDQRVDFEEELMADCPRYERALAPPYNHITLNRRLQYEAYRTKANNEY